MIEEQTWVGLKDMPLDLLVAACLGHFLDSLEVYFYYINVCIYLFLRIHREAGFTICRHFVFE